MSAAPGQVAQVACPSCQTPMRVAIVNIIDAEAQPHLKSQLLGGRLNASNCTKCGSPVILAAPLIYHDGSKQFCFVHIPQQLLASAKGVELERFVGSATNLLMNELPPDAPKGYLLAPKRFLTMQTLVEAVFEGDGVSKEMLEAQRKRVDIMSQLLDAMSQGEAALNTALQANQADIDDEFTKTLEAFVEASRMSGDPEGIAQLSALQSKIAQFAGGAATFAYETLITQLLAAGDEASVTQLITANQEIIDYTFFDIVTNRINDATTDGAESLASQLTAMRDQVIEIFQQLQADLEASYMQAGVVLDAVFDSEDLVAALNAHLPLLNETFDVLVDGQRTMAERAGDMAAAERLQTIAELTIQVKADALSPEDRVVQALITAENATRYIRENISEITSGVVKRLNEMTDDYTTKGKTEEAERVKRIAREAGAMLF
ncbi:MAG: CpXC domain-containing protein [Chloroflexales bacterium]|nr:CpXC domain-containing protein [Chloroflexales bacterium]